MRSRNLGPALVLLCATFGCAKSESRITELETRIADLDAKQRGSVEDVAALGKEHKAMKDQVAALQASEVKNTETIAALQREQAAMQEKLAILATPGTMSVEPGATSKASAGPVGIPECDEYLTKYMKCIEDKVPEAARKSMMEAMEATTKAWKEAASGPAREGLGTACKAALDAAEQATAAMGCEW